jgi:metallo-beta-lactamase class B
MKSHTLLALALASAAAAAGEKAPLKADPPKTCDGCEAWNAAAEPYRVFGNTYFVGTANLGAVLIDAGGALVLVDGGLPQSAPRIDESIRRLGFRTEDVKLVLNTHSHYDHAGGIAALQRASGARVVASAAGARALERGQPPPDDPQYAFGPEANGFPPVPHVDPVADGQGVRVGRLTVTAHLTPGHAPGGASWSWRSCEGGRCLDLVFADSLNAVSAPGFRFSGDAAHPSLEEQFRHSIDTVAGLPCDILLTGHPGGARIHAPAARATASPGSPEDASPCQAYAAAARRRLEERIAREGSAGPGAPRP